MSSPPPQDPWQGGDAPPPPPPPGGYPPPPPAGGGYPPPPPPGGGWQQPGAQYQGPGNYGYPPPPPAWQQGGGWQGGQPGTPWGYLAGWWLRVGATIVDGLLVGVPITILLAIGGASGYGLRFVEELALIIYQVLLLGAARGQTVGNMAVSTRTIDQNTGLTIGYGRATIRSLVAAVLGITIIGGILDILWPLWDSRNQTLHDKACGSLVIKTR